MDHLRSLFNEARAQEQNSYVLDGRVFIRTHHWAPEDILNGMLTPEAVNDVFEDWIAERNEDLIAQADAILKQFGLEDRFEALTEAFKRGAVMPFVGAGLSISSSYPGWTAFLRQQRRETDISEGAFEELITNGHFEEAAELLASKLGAGFNEAVHNAFGLSREVNGCVQFLPYVFNTPVVTTNFDDVLKRCYESASSPFSDTIPGDRAVELPRLLAAGSKALVKLHGTATSGNGRILTKSEYDRHYATEVDLKRAIGAVCGRTLLFVGCSLTVDRTLAVMKAIVDEQGHDNVARHYALVEDPGSDAARTLRREALLQCNIYPVWYPEGEHDSSIEAFLAKLANSTA
jgi:hypothetical protein